MKLKSLHYGWVMTTVGFFVLATNAVAVFGFGVFLKPLTAQFGWDRGSLSGAFALSSLVTGLVSIWTGQLSDRYGPRILVTIAGVLISAGFFMMVAVTQLWQVYAVWVIIGLGIGFAATPIVSSLPRWFREKRGLSLSITLAGFNFGAVVGPLLIQWLITSYSWQRAFFVLGFIPIFFSIPMAQFSKRDPKQMNILAYGEKPLAETELPPDSVNQGISFSEAIKTWRFWVFGSIQGAFGFAMQIIVIHIAAHVSDIGIPVFVAASILSIVAGTRIIGNLMTGFLSERWQVKPLFTILFVFLTLSLFWLLFADNTGGFYLFAIVFGLAGGGLIPLYTLVPAQLFGLKNIGAITGAFLLIATIGGGIGSPMAGYIYDTFQSYKAAFTISASIATIAVILTVLILRYTSSPTFDN